MEIEQWWPKLRSSSRDWLIENNGDRVPAPIADDIRQAGGPDLRVVSEEGMRGYFDDEVIDWVDAVANGEAPGSA